MEEEQKQEEPKPLALLTKENARAVLEKDDRRFEVVPVDEWGVAVRVRSLNEPEYHAYRDSVLVRAGREREVNEKTMRACLCAACVVDADGKPIFTVDDLTGGKDPSKGKSAHAIALIWKCAAKLCGMDDDDIEDLLKNCETGQRAGSS